MYIVYLYINSISIRQPLTFRYKSNAENISKKFRDRPHSPLETALYWIDYVIRYKGAPHLRSTGATLPWYQYYLVDVAAVILTVLIAALSLLFWIARAGFNLLFARTKPKEKRS